MLDYIIQQVAYDPNTNEMLIYSAQDTVEVAGGDGTVTDSDLLDQVKDMLKQDAFARP